MNSRDKVRQVITAFIGGSILLAIARFIYHLFS